MKKLEELKHYVNKLVINEPVHMPTLVRLIIEAIEEAGNK